MPVRPNPFLERRNRQAAASRPAKPSRFQQAKDWTTFIVSITSLCTATIALRNTLTGPRPFLAEMSGDAIHILRSDQFAIKAADRRMLTLRDENGIPQDFPLLIAQPALANRAPPPNGVGIRSIEGELVISRQGQTLFRSAYVWFRFTTSDSAFDSENKVDRLEFSSASQVSPFDLPGGGVWSREILFVPRQTWSAAKWDDFADKFVQECSRPGLCLGEFTLRIRLDNGVSLAEACDFTDDGHMSRHLRGEERHYFTSPTCGPNTKP